MRSVPALLVGLVVGALAAGAVAQERARTATVRRLFLTDDAGAIRAQLAVDDAGVPKLERLDADAVDRLLGQGPQAPVQAPRPTASTLRRAAEVLRNREDLGRLGEAELERFLAASGWDRGRVYVVAYLARLRASLAEARAPGADSGDALRKLDAGFARAAELLDAGDAEGAWEALRVAGPVAK